MSTLDQAGVIEAKQETLGRIENLWPLGFLAVPVVTGAVLAVELPGVVPIWLAFTGWMGLALWFVRRRGPGDIPRGVVNLLAGICLLDAMLIGGAGELGLAGLAVLGFLLTVMLQRFVPAT